MLEQLPGILEKLPLMTCMGKDFACSPASVISTIWTGPQVKPSRKGRHSAMDEPLAPICCVGEIVRAEDNILSPEDPVSTSMPSIVWQLVVLPGTQTITLVNAPLTYSPAGPVLTVKACVFATEEPEPPPGGVVVLPLPLHPAVATNAAAKLK